MPYAEVESNAEAMFGKAASHVLNYAYIQAELKEKTAQGPSKVYRRIEHTTRPYSLVKDAIACGKEMLETHGHHEHVKEEREESIEKADRPFSPQLPEEKSAGFFQTALLGANLRATNMRSAAGMNKSPEQLREGMASELNNPDHLQQLRAINTKAMLGDFLNNDEVISGYDPEEVSEAFNDISSLSPNAATQPAIMRPLLRKRLTQGAVDTHEVDQLANIEKTVTETARGGVSSQPPTNFPSGPVKESNISEVLRGHSIFN